MAKREREKRQGKLIKDSSIWHETIRAKLDGRFQTTQFSNFARCGNESIYRTCKSCRAVESFAYQCSIKWCPKCNWRITARRREILERWARRIEQPKHIVLTQKNFPILTRKALREHQKNLARIRRNEVFAAVKGGCLSIEITNEGNGWHLHSHWLVDARWVDSGKLAVEWGKLCGQSFGVVKVKDLRDEGYLREVSKYVVKGSEMATWPAEQIMEFVSAVKGRRFFFAFGTLFKQGAAIRAEIKAEKEPVRPCECGCTDFIFESEVDALLSEIRNGKKRK